MQNNCIFCKIIAGEIPSATVYEDEDFKVNPKTPKPHKIQIGRCFEFCFSLELKWGYIKIYNTLIWRVLKVQVDPPKLSFFSQYPEKASSNSIISALRKELVAMESSSNP